MKFTIKNKKRGMMKYKSDLKNWRILLKIENK